MASSYYVYYRVSEESVIKAREAVRAMIERIGAFTGVKGRHLQKAEDPLLWMEIYENVPNDAAFERALAGAVQSCEFTRFLEPGGARKAERFQPCA
ncbi:MAG: DUF4936 family protein [Burkholderiales bacterium]